MNTALLVIDVQIGSFLEKRPLYKSDLLNNIHFLIKMARIEKFPVIFTKHNGKVGTIRRGSQDGRFILSSFRFVEKI